MRFVGNLLSQRHFLAVSDLSSGTGLRGTHSGAMTGTAMRALLCVLLLLSLAGAVADAAEGETGKAEDGSCASTEVRPDRARRAGPKRWGHVARGGVRRAAVCSGVQRREAVCVCARADPRTPRRSKRLSQSTSRRRQRSQLFSSCTSRPTTTGRRRLRCSRSPTAVRLMACTAGQLSAPGPLPRAVCA